jgi:hypothetical protein
VAYASRGNRLLDIVTQAQLAPQQLALEQARAQRESATTNAWLSAVGPLLSQATGAASKGYDALAAQAGADANNAVTANAGAVGDRLVGPLNEGVTERPYAQTPGELAAAAVPESGKPTNMLEWVADGAKKQAEAAARARIAGGVATNRVAADDKAFGRNLQTRTLDISEGNKVRDDTRAATEDKAKAKERAYAKLDDVLTPYVQTELDSSARSPIYSADTKLAIAQAMKANPDLTKEEAQGVYEKTFYAARAKRESLKLQERAVSAAELTAHNGKPLSEPATNDVYNASEAIRKIDDAIGYVNHNADSMGPLLGTLSSNTTFGDLKDKMTGSSLGTTESLLKQISLQLQTDANEGRLAKNDSEELRSVALGINRNPDFVLDFLARYRAALIRKRDMRLNPSASAPATRPAPPPDF